MGKKKRSSKGEQEASKESEEDDAQMGKKKDDGGGAGVGGGGRGGGGGGSGGGAAPSSVVLKADLHCEGCILKIKKAIKRVEGVEKITFNLDKNTVTVAGKADPWELKEQIESKAQKSVTLISPANPPKKKEGGDSAAAAKNSGKDKKSDEKTKELPESTMVFKTRLHCDGCIKEIRRTLKKLKGVKEVSIDAVKDLVTVKGLIDSKVFPDVLKEKLKRYVELVPPSKKDDGGKSGGSDNKEKADAKNKGGGDKKYGEEKKDSNDDEGGDEKHKSDDAGSGDGEGKKKAKGKKDQNNEKAAAAAAAATAVPEGVYYAVPPEMLGMFGGPVRVEMPYAPQLFSDENPNACAVM